MTSDPEDPFFRLAAVAVGAGVAVGFRVTTGRVNIGVVEAAKGFVFGVTVVSQPAQLVETGVAVTGAMVGVGVPAGGMVWNWMVPLLPLSVRPVFEISSVGT